MEAPNTENQGRNASRVGIVHYFYDSYAIIELVKGNQNYLKYGDEVVTITIFNLAEIYWSVLNDFDENTAENIYRKFRDSVIDIDDETLKEAIKFRKKYKKNNLSYTDCIGYIYALKHKLVFLTGDKEFENLENVEFVK